MNLFETFNQQKKDFLLNEIPSYEIRKSQLETLLKVIKANSKNLAEAVNQDFGHRSFDETELLEIIPTLQTIKYYLKHLKKWMRPRRAKVSFWFKPGVAKIYPQPLGVIGIVVPWNYPIQLSLGPLVAALSAGNRVMIKMSELTPNTGKLIRDLLAEVFSEERLVVINGDVEIAKEFVLLPFDHLLFTGSTEVGKKVMMSASNHLTSVTLELGGKSPVIIVPDSSIRSAVRSIMTGKLFNAGQTCVAPDYVFLPDGSESLFIEEAKNFVEKHYHNITQNDDYSSIINQKHFDRLENLLKEAESNGAKIIRLENNFNNAENKKIVPCIILNCNDEMKIMQEEIFGPYLPLIPYQEIKEVVDQINRRPYPLALYLFDERLRYADFVLKNTISGGVTVNETLLHVAQESLPFGGVGESGIGQYHGKAGFDTFSHLKSIFFQSRLNGFALMRPPFGKFVRLIMQLMRL